MEEIIKIKRITALSDMKLLVEFKNGINKLYDVHRLMDSYDYFKPLEDPELFRKASADYNGSGVIWNEDLDVSEWELWNNGVEIPLTADDLSQYLQNNHIGTSEVCNLLGCSRQNVDFLMKTGKIKPVMQLKNNKLFALSDVMAYKYRYENESYKNSFELN